MTSGHLFPFQITRDKLHHRRAPIWALQRFEALSDFYMVSTFDERWDKRRADTLALPEEKPATVGGPASPVARTFHLLGGVILGAFWLIFGLGMLSLCLTLIGIVFAWILLMPWALLGAAALRSLTIAITGLPPSKLAYDARLVAEVQSERAAEKREDDLNRVRRDLPRV